MSKPLQAKPKTIIVTGAPQGVLRPVGLITNTNRSLTQEGRS